MRRACRRSRRALAPHGPLESRGASLSYGADRRRLVRHLSGQGRRAPFLRQAGAAEAQGRGPLGSADRTQRGGGGLDARRRGLAAARRSARPRRGREGRPVCNGLSRARGYSLWKTSSSLAVSSRIRGRGRARPRPHPRPERGRPRHSEAFANDDTFEAIRIEPYLRATRRAHPALAPRSTTSHERPFRRNVR